MTFIKAFITSILMIGLIVTTSPAALQYSGALSGTVVDELRRPLPLTQVHLERVPGEPIDTALADDAGSFSFQGIDPGRYVLRAVRPGFVQPRWAPGEATRIIVVKAGSAQSVSVRLVRGAAVSGRVVSPTGAPVGGARVHALRCNPSGATCRSAPIAGSSVDTNDRGEFRLFGLAPGEYILGALARLTGNSEVVHSSVPSVTAWAERMSANNGAAATPAAPSATPRPVHWAMTYFPGAIRPREGTPIVVRGDEEVSEIEIRLAVGGAGSVAGIVSSPTGPPPRSLLFLPDDSVIGAPCGPTVLVQPAGQFRTAACPDGAYRLVGRSGDGGAVAEWAEVRLQLAGSDVSDLPITLQSTNMIAAVITVDGAAPDSTVQLSATGLLVRRRDVAVAVSPIDTIRGFASPTGRVELVGLLPGDYDVSPIGEGRSLWARGLLSADGQDLFDEGLTVRQNASSGDLRLELSRRPSLVRGTVTETEGRPQPSFLLVAFPFEASLRSRTRRVRTAQVADDGTFEIVGLPDGEYVVGLVGTNDPADLSEELFAQITPVGQRISVTWGLETSVSLRIKLPFDAGLPQQHRNGRNQLPQ